MPRPVCVVVGLFIAVILQTSTASATVVVKEGKSTSVLLLAATADEHEKAAARELKTAFQEVAGADITTQTLASASDLKDALNAVRAAGQIPITIGTLAQPHVERMLIDKKQPELSRGAFGLHVTPEGLFISGPGEGTYYGAIELLEQIGCRWFMPGDLGIVRPSLKTIDFKDQWTVQRPSFPSRWFQMPHREWQLQVRCGGEPFPGAHGLPTPKIKVDKATGTIEPAEYAEWFALSKGKRSTRQHCLSNPQLLAYVVEQVKSQRKNGRGPVIGMGPNDGGGFCECEHCRALDGGDFDPFSNEASVTDRYIWFFNEVLKRVDSDFPDTKLAFYVYHSYMRPPVKWKPDARIMGALAPIALDRVHGFSNPVAPEKSYERWLFQEWGKLLPELYDRGYWSNLACPGFPFIIVHRLRDEIPACHQFGVKGWRVETFPNYASQFPSMYVAGKLMWNHEADVDALLDDCFQKFFGPAAKPMGDYIRLMDAALRDSDHSTGSSWDMPLHYPLELRLRARQFLAEGRQRASGHGIYEQRVTAIGQTFELLEAFIGMLDARVRVDFVSAQEELKKLDEVAEKLMNQQPVPMLSAGRFSTYTNYMKRFFRPCTEQGYARVTNGNRLIAAAKDEWQFQIDPAKVGEDVGFWRANLKGGNWQTIKSSSLSWSNQGLRYYKGLAWYRQTVEVPKEAVGQRVFLWCGGVDELAKVWINGKPVGISHGAAFYPFEMDATEMIAAGPNELTICVSNQVVNELGTGGIVAPVMLYAPAAGNEAKLENIRDLKPTFP